MLISQILQSVNIGLISMLHFIVIHPQILEKLMKLYENTYFLPRAAIFEKIT